MFCSVALRLTMIASLILVCGSSYADELAMSADGCRLSEMKLIISRAAERKLRFAQLSAKAIGSRVVYDYALEPNTGDAWFAHFNLSPEKLDSLEDGFAQQGFTRVIESEVWVPGGRRLTVVWQKVFPPRPLTLPGVELPESGASPPAFRMLDTAMRSFMERHNVAGAAVAIGQEGQIVYSRAFGYSNVDEQTPLSPDSTMRIASLSKIITAATVMKLIQQKRLRLDSLVLPLLQAGGFELPSTIDERWGLITVRHLLDHQGGWDSKQSNDPLFESALISRKLKLRREVSSSDVVTFQLGQSLDYSPGTRQVYSNFGYLLLGRIIQQVANRDYADVVRELVLEPRGMLATELGRSQRDHQTKNEVAYHMQDTTCHRPFWALSARKVDLVVAHVDAPYGQWDLRLLGSAAGWVSTAPDLVRLLSKSDVIPDDGFRNGSWKFGWKVDEASNRDSAVTAMSLNGYLAGTSALLWKTDDVCCVVLFNTDDSIHGGSLADWVKPVVIRHAVRAVNLASGKSLP